MTAGNTELAGHDGARSHSRSAVACLHAPQRAGRDHSARKTRSPYQELLTRAKRALEKRRISDDLRWATDATKVAAPAPMDLASRRRSGCAFFGCSLRVESSVVKVGPAQRLLIALRLISVAVCVFYLRLVYIAHPSS